MRPGSARCRSLTCLPPLLFRHVIGCIKSRHAIVYALAIGSSVGRARFLAHALNAARRRLRRLNLSILRSWRGAASPEIRINCVGILPGRGCIAS